MAGIPKISDVQRQPTAIDAGTSRRSRWWWLIILLLLLAIAVFFLTRPKRAAGPFLPVFNTDSNDLITRIYDVHDLIFGIPNFVPPGATRPAASQPQHTQQQLVNDLITKITSSVDPQSWRANAGSIGTIREMGGHLTITQSRLNHERIHNKLEELRAAARVVQVNVEMRIVAPPPANQLVPSPGLQWTSLKQDEAALWPQFLDDMGRSALIHAANANPSGTIVTAPRLNLFDGQRAYVLVSRHTAYVSSFAKVPATTTQPASFAPKIGLADSGILFDCQANVSDDRNFVTLALRPKLTSLLDITPASWRGAPPGRTDLIVQVPHIRETSLDATITMPTDMTAVYRVRSSQTPPATRPSEETVSLLIITPHVITQTQSHNPATSQSAIAK